MPAPAFEGALQTGLDFLGRMLDQTARKLPDVAAAFGAQRELAEASLRKSVEENDEFWESHFELGGVAA